MSFGLVSVPVELFPATRATGVAMRMLAPDGTPLARRYYDTERGRDLAPDQLIRGYEVEPERHVPVSDDELESVAPRKSRDIDLRLFVALDEIDPVLLSRSFVLAPSGDSTKPYRLLAEVLERERRAGIATAVVRNKETLLAIVAERGILLGHALRFASELRLPSDVGLPKPHRAKPALAHAFSRAITRLEKPAIDVRELVDAREKALRTLVERKAKRGADIVESPEVEALDDEFDGEAEGGGDLFETIRKSLHSAGRAKPKLQLVKREGRAR